MSKAEFAGEVPQFDFEQQVVDQSEVIRAEAMPDGSLLAGDEAHEAEH